MNNGTLFYIVGPSGVGKDTLIEGAKIKLTQAKVVFMQRYITRPNVEGAESHIAITKEDFQLKIQEGFFSLWWKSHDNFYGISSDIKVLLRHGINVVVNGSRGYFDTALDCFPEMKTVLITADPKVIEQRLIARGRETSKEIEKRVARSLSFTDFINKTGVLVLENNDSVEASVAQLSEILKQ